MQPAPFSGQVSGGGLARGWGLRWGRAGPWQCAIVSPRIALMVGSSVRRRLYWLLGAAALVAATVALAVGLRARRARSGEAAGVLLAAPDDAWLILTVDVAAARPLLEPLLGVGEGRLATATRAAGLGSLIDACGFDPVQHVRELMVAAPEGGERGDFGVAFSADLTMDELASCARKAIVARGGTPSTTMRGDFAVIGDESAPKQARLAYRDGGPFLVGRGAWLEAMVDAAAGRGAHAHSEHAALRSALSAAGAASRAVVITALLPKSLRDRLRTETDGGASGAFAGVLGVEEAGAAVTVSDAATALEIELRCETAAACDDVKELIEKWRLSLSSHFGARLMGFGPLIDGLSIDASGAGALAVRTHLPTADLAQALARLWDRAPDPRGPGSGVHRDAGRDAGIDRPTSP
jgi:hypothetical protein